MSKQWRHLIPARLRFAELSRETVAFWGLFLYLELFPVAVILAVNLKNPNAWKILPENLLLAGVLLLLYAALLLPVMLLRTRIRTALLWTILGVIGVFNFLDLFLFAHFQAQLQLVFINLALDTNSGETANFASTYLAEPRNLFLLLYPAIGILFYLGMRWKRGLIALLPLFLLVAWISARLTLPTPSFDADRYAVKWLPNLADSIIEEYLDQEFLAADIAEANRALDVRTQERQATYLLLIGESNSKARNSLYGYPRQTQPLLQKRVDAGELLLYQDTVAPHSLTMLVLPKLLSLEHHGASQTYTEVPNIIDMMKTAGFKTWWLSNQEYIAARNVSYLLLAARSNVMRHTPDSGNRTDDAQLLPLLQEALNDPAPLKFIILHLRENHSPYHTTYPADFQPFPLEESPRWYNEQQREHARTLNEYDTSIRYADQVQNEILNLLERHGGNSALLYLSDHGENLYEEPNMVAHFEFMPTRRTVEVPMYLYLSPEYRAKLPPEALSLLRRSTVLPFGSEHLPHLMLELFRIQTPLLDAARSPLNPGFRPSKRVISSCGIDYEKLKTASYQDRLHNRNLR